MESPLNSLALIVVLGIAAQWAAWRLRIPSIVLLLLAGFVAGAWIDSDDLFGKSMMPLVSLSVAIILFEGGLELRLRELRTIGRPVLALVSVGIVITFALVALLARYALSFDWPAALVLGSILVVTGPTVVGPMLRAIRPRGEAGPILKWEGILNDAVGAVLAVLVFEAVIAGATTVDPVVIAWGVLKTLGVGAILGALGAYVLTEVLRRRIVPDHLDVLVTIGLVIGVFALSNLFQHESGLLAVTLMGVVLANQPYTDVRHVIEFKENLRQLLLSILFIILASRIDLPAVIALGGGSLLFVAALVFLVRPLCVFPCLVGSGLPWQDRVFISFLAPRGIVAAAIGSVFGLQMVEAEMGNGDQIVPVVFLVITLTVVFYGFLAPILARKLHLAATARNGIVLVGGEPMNRAICHALKKEKIDLLLVDSNRGHISQARLEGLNARYGDALSMRFVQELDLSNMGTLLALTQNDHVNSLAALHFGEIFGKHDVYQLARDAERGPGIDAKSFPERLGGKIVVGPEFNHAALRTLFQNGAVVKSSLLTEKFSYEDYQDHYENRAIVLFRIGEDGVLQICTADTASKPQPGEKLISVIPTELIEGNGEQNIA